LQRDRFLPAIALIKTHCRIFNLDSGTDYRLRALENTKLYYAPCDGLAINAIWQSVLALTTEEKIREGGFIEIKRRQIPVRFVTEDLAWFDFNEICGSGRAVPDYIEVAKVYHTVVITAVPDLVIAGDDFTRRFLHLVDEFYDRSVNLILGADVSMEALYIAGRLTFEMERCRSRLLEMQSVEYLERPHRPD
jgi:cell division protein ZapE